MRSQKFHAINEALDVIVPGFSVVSTVYSAPTPLTNLTTSKILMKQSKDPLYCLFGIKRWNVVFR